MPREVFGLFRPRTCIFVARPARIPRAFHPDRPLVRPILTWAPGTGPMPLVSVKNLSYPLDMQNLLVVQNRAETEVRQPLRWFRSEPAVLGKQ